MKTNKQYEDTYTDEMGTEYVLVPFESKKGDLASVGCIFKHWQGACGASHGCHSAPTCTPRDQYGNPLVHGRHVWQDKNHQFSA